MFSRCYGIIDGFYRNQWIRLGGLGFNGSHIKNQLTLDVLFNFLKLGLDLLQLLLWNHCDQFVNLQLQQPHQSHAPLLPFHCHRYCSHTFVPMQYSLPIAMAIQRALFLVRVRRKCSTEHELIVCWAEKTKKIIQIDNSFMVWVSWQMSRH